MLNTKKWIEKAKQVHGDKYDYSKVEYINSKTKICIICPKHGEFWQSPNAHSNSKQGCPKCSKLYNYTTKEWIEKAKQVHGDKYDYSKVDYVNNRIKICIICKEHGEFWQTPHNHLSQKQGCPKCYGTKLKTNEEFIEESEKVHGKRFDYSKVEYINAITKVCIICKEHGEFWQRPIMHIRGNGCPKCANKNVTTEEFIEKAKKIHGDRYDYSKVEYINAHTKVCIICPEHGTFTQKPGNHLQGDACPRCKESKLEKEIRFLLEGKKIKYEQWKRFKWLKYKSYLELDFYLPDYNIAIECQGRQHFENNNFFGGDSEYKKVKMRDERKFNLCKEHNIKILYYTDPKINETIITDKNKLLSIIKNE